MYNSMQKRGLLIFTTIFVCSQIFRCLTISFDLFALFLMIRHLKFHSLNLPTTVQVSSSKTRNGSRVCLNPNKRFCFLVTCVIYSYKHNIITISIQIAQSSGYKIMTKKNNNNKKKKTFWPFLKFRKLAFSIIMIMKFPFFPIRKIIILKDSKSLFWIIIK